MKEAIPARWRIDRYLPVVRATGERVMKQWLIALAAFAMAVHMTPARAQHIIHVPQAGEPKAEASPDPDRRMLEEDEQLAPRGCWTSIEQVDAPSGTRTITRQMCH
jgi:hypothetical protein